MTGEARGSARRRAWDTALRLHLGRHFQHQRTETPRPSRRRLEKRRSRRRRPRGSAHPSASEAPRPLLWGKVKPTRVCPEDAPRPLPSLSRAGHQGEAAAASSCQAEADSVPGHSALQPLGELLGGRGRRRKCGFETGSRGGRGGLALQERSTRRPREPRGLEERPAVMGELAVGRPGAD